MKKPAALHHHKKWQGLGKHEKVLIMDQKNKLLIRVREGVYDCKKKYRQPPLKLAVLKIATAQKLMPALLYRL